MWEWITNNTTAVAIFVFFIFAAILPFTGIVEFGQRLRAEIEAEEKAENEANACNKIQNKVKKQSSKES